MELMVIGVLVLLLLLLLLGVNIGVALGVAGMVGLYVVAGEQALWGQLRELPYGAAAVYTLAVIPMFLLMGSLFTQAGYTQDIYNSAFKWFGRFRGGLVAATIAASGAFGALTGSSVANAAVFAKVSIPEMVRHGVDKKLAGGAVAAAGAVSSLIPPSILLVVYGIMSESSVSALLIAGIIPGILTLVMFYVLAVYLRILRNPSLAPPLNVSFKLSEKFASLGPVWPAVIVFMLMMGGLYAGILTATQAGAVGALAALIIGLAHRRLGPSRVWGALQESAQVTGTLLLIIIGGVIFARFLGYSGIVREFSAAMLGMELPGFAYLLIFVGILFLVGMFMEAFSTIVLILPLMLPVLLELGYDPIWLGIITVKALEIGLMTPPVGLNVYVVKGTSPVPLTLSDTFRGVLPFVLVDLLTLALLIAFPMITLLLPSLMIT